MKNRIIFSLLAALLLLAMSVTLLAGCDFPNIFGEKTNDNQESTDAAKSPEKQSQNSESAEKPETSSASEISCWGSAYQASVRSEQDEYDINDVWIVFRYGFLDNCGYDEYYGNLSVQCAPFVVPEDDIRFVRRETGLLESEYILAKGDADRIRHSERINLPKELFTMEKGGLIYISASIHDLAVTEYIAEYGVGTYKKIGDEEVDIYTRRMVNAR